MFLVWQYLSNEDRRLNEAYGTFYTMVVANRDILQYETLRPTDVDTVKVPTAMVPPGLIASQQDVVDSIAAVPISKGEQILDNKIISKNVYSGLDRQIGIGKRAISIPVNFKSGVGYLLRPGNRIDLAAHFEYKTPGANISEVKVFLQDLLILAAGRTIQTESPKAVDQSLVRSVVASNNQTPVDEIRDTLNYAKTDSNYQTVTVEVTPDQAQKIAYVQTTYADALLALLRHTDDRAISSAGSTTNMIDVMGNESYFVRGDKMPPPRSVPRVRFYDFVGDQAVGVRDGGSP